ncbi:hypothetical protein [Streptomyces sp. Mg1]|uniref:hypothetical protein n=1 Tax=Streptomyces sp. Mg1 TaxID=465541 RepID=UPI0005618649|nr:hypothetical protein [Streptomyces sp. Mg1]AKL71215.1 hypothetical protein M444_38320 [Streptomyces sp. Mg1]
MAAVYNETVPAEVCQALRVATEPRIVTAGRLPVMQTSRGAARADRLDPAQRPDRRLPFEREHEYVTAVDDDGGLRFLPVVSEKVRARLNRIARMPRALSLCTLGV